MRLPDGFVEHALGEGLLLICRHDRVAAAVAAGLGSPVGWQARLHPAPGRSTGRGAVGRLDLPGGAPLHLKQMRRGGVLARWRGDCFRGTRRLLGNLSVPLEAIRRGLPTAAPVVLLLSRGSSGWYQAWLGVEEIAEAESLRARLASADVSEDELRAALRVVRTMHDRGLVHPDLNLGNLLSRPGPAGWEAFVIDLDRARVTRAGVAFRGRQAALRRLERSYEKSFGKAGPLAPHGAEVWYRLYAEEREDLARRLARGRTAGKIWLGFHRLGWRLAGNLEETR